MGNLISTLTLAIFVMLNGGETLPTGRELVEQFIAAKGGKERLLQTRNVRIHAQIEYLDEVIASAVILQAEGRRRTITEFVDGTRSAHGTDGTVAWSLSRDRTLEYLQGTDLNLYLKHNSTLHEAIGWLTDYQDIRTHAEVRVNGRAIYEVHFVHHDDRTTVRYFDQETALLVREVTPAGSAIAEAVSDISDYREVEGVLVSHLRRVTQNGQETTFRIQQVETNLYLAPGQFLPPLERFRNREDGR